MTKRRSLPVRAPDAIRRAAILNAAFSLLMQRGYERTSTLDIVTRAKISKRELYQLFDSKQAILTACITARAERMCRPLQLTAPQDHQTFVAVLRSFGSTFLREICDPAVVAVYRLAAIEAQRSPEVARMIDNAGREMNRAALIRLLRHAQSLGMLGAGDPSTMASEFFGLLVGDLLLRLILRVTDPPTSNEISRRARVATEALVLLHAETNSKS